MAALSTRPVLYLPLARLKFRSKEGPRPVTRETEIVLDGYPRSGNTFAVEAFRLAQGRPVEIAHHLHAAAQIIAGARRGLPTVLLLREPENAVCSLVVRLRWLDLDEALRRYVRMHEALGPYRERFLAAPFDQVTTDFGAAIREVNRRFGTEFSPFEHTEENVRHCFRLIERKNLERFGGGQIDELSVARPSAERAAEVQALRRGFRSNELRSLRDRAYRSHDLLVER